jgi:aspartokinase
MSIVMKFGGTSVADAAALERVASIVAAHRDDCPVVVVSAMSGVTDALLASTSIATQQGFNAAIKSLDDTFRRHHHAAQQLLPHSADPFSTYLDHAAVRISQLLQTVAGVSATRRATQDAIVSLLRH